MSNKFSKGNNLASTSNEYYNQLEKLKSDALDTFEDGLDNKEYKKALLNLNDEYAKNMKDAWKQLEAQRSLFFRKPAKCLTCDDSKFCDYCPGYLSLVNKSTTFSSGDCQYHCAVAKNRHKKYLEQNLLEFCHFLEERLAKS